MSKVFNEVLRANEAYVDAFGDVSPCVFTPMSFGNVQNKSVTEVFDDMREHFPSEDGCFINKNYRLLQKYSAGHKVLAREDALRMLEDVHFGELSTFNRLYDGSGREHASASEAQILK